LARQADDRLQLDIFLDQSVLEVFVNGYAAFATRIYPTLPESVALHASASGGAATVGSLAIQRMPPLSARSA
jgi:sucrose-6-phosphate hydrolase SacC (GH32 family)